MALVGPLWPRQRRTPRPSPSLVLPRSGCNGPPSAFRHPRLPNHPRSPKTHHGPPLAPDGPFGYTLPAAPADGRLTWCAPHATAGAVRGRRRPRARVYRCGYVSLADRCRPYRKPGAGHGPPSSKPYRAGRPGPRHSRGVGSVPRAGANAHGGVHGGGEAAGRLGASSPAWCLLLSMGESGFVHRGGESHIVPNAASPQIC
jgi:hypothetical protein